MDDPYNAGRFLEGQQSVIDQVYSELRNGRKRSHWMWYIFPQIKSLGYRRISVKYSISSLEEARAYLSHPVLGPRLRECTRLVNQIPGRPVEDIFLLPGRPEISLVGHTLCPRRARQPGFCGSPAKVFQWGF